MNAKQIKKLREEKNITQLQLAILCGVSAPAVSMWESDKKKPRKSSVKLLEMVQDGCDGYKAFEKATREMLDSAQNAKPRRVRKGYKLRAEYREGYYDGILAVWCLLALVDHPRHPINAEQIRRILSSEND